MESFIIMRQVTESVITVLSFSRSVSDHIQHTMLQLHKSTSVSGRDMEGAIGESIKHLQLTDELIKEIIENMDKNEK